MNYTSLSDVQAEFDLLGELGGIETYDERMRLIRHLGESLEPMPDALKTDSTQVQGCQSKVWVYPLPHSNSDHLHFLADSNSVITKGVIALILLAVQDKSADEILTTDIEGLLRPFDVEKHFTSKRTSGVANMIGLIRETAERLK